MPDNQPADKRHGIDRNAQEKASTSTTPPGQPIKPKYGDKLIVKRKGT